MIASFDSLCPSCGDEIRAGDEIRKMPGAPATHADCETDAVETTRPARPEQTRAATASERDTGAERTAKMLAARVDELAEHLAQEIRARAALVRAVQALVELISPLSPLFGEPQAQALRDALADVAQATSTNPLDRAAARAAVDPTVGF